MKISQVGVKFEHDRIAAFCRARGIRRLSLFGSVVRKDFDPEQSDIDVLAEFNPGALHGVGFRYMRYAEELSEIMGQKVDLCSRLSPHIESKVRAEAIEIYEQA